MYVSLSCVSLSLGVSLFILEEPGMPEGMTIGRVQCKLYEGVVCCSVLQCVAVCCSVLQWNVLQ